VDAQPVAMAIALFVGLAIGGITAWWATRSSLRLLQAAAARSDQDAAALRRELDAATAALDRARDEVARLDERSSRVPALEEQWRAAQAQLASAKEELAQLRATLEAERAQAQKQVALLQEARTELSNQFKALAADILEEKAKRFAETNQLAIGQIVDPLRQRIVEFKAKVEEIHAKDVEHQAALRAELSQLKELNRQITEEAHGLAVALKGQSKKQGNWGELILANVLDRAGLVEGKDYRREVSFETEDGRRRPDVVLSLPQQKHLVIDAKVSLNAYTRYVNADDAGERELALREHVAAIAARIQELADRNYFDLPGINSPEVVFMFVPVESAFVEAVRADDSLVQRALERNILLATPTTLLTSLNIVRQLWRFEEQNRHTAELADRASKVYAKLVTFLGSMESLGKQLNSAQRSYDAAMGQLTHGPGNMVKQVKEFERLGVAVKSQLPKELVEKAALELEFTPLTPAPIPFKPAEDASSA
jgi:DNA recombination protein RmuC